MEVSTTLVRRSEYRIDRYFHSDRMYASFYVWEPSQSIPGGQSTIKVDVYAPSKSVFDDGVEGARVSWPSTSDKRPLVARALAEALTLAAAEADRLNDLAYVADGDYQSDIEPGTLVFLLREEVEGDPVDDIRVWTIVDPVLHTETQVPSGSLAKAVS